jgi:site-specific recombinase XerD
MMKKGGLDMNPVRNGNKIGKCNHRVINAGNKTSISNGVNQWILDGRKFLSDEEIKRLKMSCQTIRDSLIIKLALYSGLRVKEIADLKCGDISLETEPACAGASAGRPASLTVRNGKGGKTRLVMFNGELKLALMEYLKDKKIKGEEIIADAPLLKSDKSGGHLSKRTLQRVFERMAKMAGITGHCFHHLRHTYASHLYKASGYNLRLVQKQLGHANIRTTQIYADVFDEDLNKALEKLYI